MPPELQRADYAVSSNVARTVHATRQAVIDVRSAADWLEQQGYESIGLVGTSLGSCYAFLASTHDSRLKVNVFNREAHEQRLAGRPVGAHALHHLDGEAHPVQFAAAVLVVAHIGERREELMDR